MKLPKTVHKNLFVVLVASLLMLGGLSAALKPSVKTWGEAVSGLQMTIYLDQAEGAPSKAPKFRVELRNAGRVDPFVVPIPVDATFSIPVNLDAYWPAASKEGFDYKLKPGNYSLEAQFIILIARVSTTRLRIAESAQGRNPDESWAK